MWPKGTTQWPTAVLQLQFHKARQVCVCTCAWGGSKSAPKSLLGFQSSPGRTLLAPLVIPKSRSERQGRRLVTSLNRKMRKHCRSSPWLCRRLGIVSFGCLFPHLYTGAKWVEGSVKHVGRTSHPGVRRKCVQVPWVEPWRGQRGGHRFSNGPMSPQISSVYSKRLGEGFLGLSPRPSVVTRPSHSPFFLS